MRASPVLLALVCLGPGLAGGCASDKAARTEVVELGRKVDRLREQTGRDGRLVRQLENRIFLLEDKLETVAVASARTPDAVPHLPVVRKSNPRPITAASSSGSGEYPPAPDPGAGASAEPSAEPSTEASTEASSTSGSVAGDDGNEGDVEVVYEGAAARDDGPRPILRLHESDRGDDMIPVDAESVPRPRPRVAPVQTEARRPPEGFPDPAQVTDRIPVAPMPRAGVPGEIAGDPVGVYREAQAALLRREHVVAIAGFQKFLKKWPDHDYADNSQYWLGEAYYDQRNYEQALTEFRRVVKRYPSGNKAPDALLKIGYCYAKLGDLAAARDVLAQVVEVYPKTEAARLATKRLEELRP